MGKITTSTILTFVAWSIGRDRVKSKVLPYSLPSAGPGPDPGVQAASPQVSLSHLPGGRLSLRSAKPAVTFSAKSVTAHRPVPSYTAR